MTDQQIEAEIQAKGLTAPRITPADIEAEIIAETYFTAAEGGLGAYKSNNDTYQGTGLIHHDSLGLLTFCVLVLSNGFTKPKTPKLSEAYQFFTGRDLDGAHNAMVDVDGCIAVYWAVRDRQQAAA